MQTQTIGANPTLVTADYPELMENAARPETQGNPVHAACLAWEEAHWQEHHATQIYARRGTFEEFRTAYQTGYESYFRIGWPGLDFDDVEAILRERFETEDNLPALPWSIVRPAVQAAWQRLAGEGRQGMYE